MLKGRSEYTKPGAIIQTHWPPKTTAKMNKWSPFKTTEDTEIYEPS